MARLSMLELRLTTDVKRIASMRDAIARECARVNAGSDHAETVASIVEMLVDADGGAPSPGRRTRSDRRGDVLVLVTVHSDATMLMLRDSRPVAADLGSRRRALLEAGTARWSTMSGADGRTIWAEIERRPPVAAPGPPDPVPVVAAAAGRVPAKPAPRLTRGVPCAR